MDRFEAQEARRRKIEAAAAAMDAETAEVRRRIQLNSERKPKLTFHQQRIVEGIMALLFGQKL